MTTGRMGRPGAGSRAHVAIPPGIITTDRLIAWGIMVRRTLRSLQGSLRPGARADPEPGRRVAIPPGIITTRSCPRRCARPPDHVAIPPGIITTCPRLHHDDRARAVAIPPGIITTLSSLPSCSRCLACCDPSRDHYDRQPRARRVGAAVHVAIPPGIITTQSLQHQLGKRVVLRSLQGSLLPDGKVPGRSSLAGPISGTFCSSLAVVHPPRSQYVRSSLEAKSAPLPAWRRCRPTVQPISPSWRIR